MGGLYTKLLPLTVEVYLSHQLQSHCAYRQVERLANHVAGNAVFRSTEDAQFQSDCARYECLVGHQRRLDFINSNDADDVMKGRSIYKTFADVVDYGKIYRGVRKVVGKDNESAGTVVKPYTGES